MSGTPNLNGEQKPDPTFLTNKAGPEHKPMGLPIEPRESLKPQKRLSRRELENLLDDYYNDAESSPSIDKQHNHAVTAGSRMVRNLAVASCIALASGFGLGLYSLSNSGSETSAGKQFNSMLATLWQPVKNVVAGDREAEAAKTWRNANGAVVKPVKTASLVVADASGTIQAGIPLKLSLTSDTDRSLLSIKVMNVPGDAILTAGKRLADGVWVLQPRELENVALVLSSARKTPLELSVELVEAKTGELLSPIREIKVAVTSAKPFKVGGL